LTIWAKYGGKTAPKKGGKHQKRVVSTNLNPSGKNNQPGKEREKWEKKGEEKKKVTRKKGGGLGVFGEKKFGG